MNRQKSIPRYRSGTVDKPTRRLGHSAPRRLLLAGAIATALIVLLSALGVAVPAMSSVSHAAHTIGTIVVLHGKGESRGAESSSGSESQIASLHAVPSPGYVCAAKGSKYSIKLILTQERYDRLVERGWTLRYEPKRTARLTRLRCPSYADDDGAD